MFRDRRVGQSKMSRRIIFEALLVVLQLRWDELRGRGPRRRVRRPGAVTPATTERHARLGERRRRRGGARGPGHPRRAAAPGPRACPDHRDLPARAARRVRADAARGRVLHAPPRGGRRRPGPARRASRRRAPPVAADPASALRRADDRSVLPARRRARRRLARGPSGAAGVVYHAAGGDVPLGLRHPLVVTLLDLAPWELPERYQQSPASRFGQRLRARVLRDAAAVIVASEATATDARRLLRVRRAALRVVPLAPRPEFRPVTDRAASSSGAATPRPDRTTTSSTRAATTPATTSRRCCAALAILRETTPDAAPAASARRRRTAPRWPARRDARASTTCSPTRRSPTRASRPR